MLEAPRVFSLFIGRLHDIFRPFLVDVEGSFSKKTFRCSFLLCSPQFSYCRFMFHLQPSPPTFLHLHTLDLECMAAFESIWGETASFLYRWWLTVVLSLDPISKSAKCGSLVQNGVPSCFWSFDALSVCCLWSCWFKVSMVRCCCFVMIPWIFECLWHWSGFLTS